MRRNFVLLATTFDSFGIWSGHLDLDQDFYTGGGPIDLLAPYKSAGRGSSERTPAIETYFPLFAFFSQLGPLPKFRLRGIYVMILLIGLSGPLRLIIPYVLLEAVPGIFLGAEGSLFPICHF